MLSLPEIYLISSEINYTVPSFILRIKSNLSHNAIFQVENFQLNLLKNGIKYDFIRKENVSISNYKNFADIHNRIIEANLEFSFPFNLINDTIFVEVNASAKGKYYKYISHSIDIDYNKMFEGKCFIKKPFEFITCGVLIQFT